MPFATECATENFCGNLFVLNNIKGINLLFLLFFSICDHYARPFVLESKEKIDTQNFLSGSFSLAGHS